MNKTIHRNTESTTKVFDQRSLARDYATLVPLLREGMRVLDVGCGTGAITKDIARYIGQTGCVTGIDNTEAFIASGKETYSDVPNLELIHADLFEYKSPAEFDLVISARVLQWLSDPKTALTRLVSFLKPGGQLSVLDYNHEALEWKPAPPESMLIFYKAFLQWRADAGMDNRIGDHLAGHLTALGMHSVTVIDADERYEKSQDDFIERAGIWLKVAELKQIVEEGYLTEPMRQKAIEEYSAWLENDAESMTMKLKEVRAQI